jgi:hypothetical protein
MNKQQFLDLPVPEQNALVSHSGVFLISFDQDDTSVSFHRLDHLFVKTISRHDGYRHVEVHTAQDVLKLTPMSGDPANLLFAYTPC